jgi:hypothetical protein
VYGGGGGGFGAKVSSGPKPMSKKDAIKKSPKEVRWTTPSEIAQATRERIEADVATVPTCTRSWQLNSIRTEMECPSVQPST